MWAAWLATSMRSFLFNKPVDYSGRIARIRFVEIHFKDIRISRNKDLSNFFILVFLFAERHPGNDNISGLCVNCCELLSH